MVPPLHTFPSLFEWGGQQNFRTPVLLTRINRCRFDLPDGRFAPTETAMYDVDPSKQAHFCDSF